MTTCAECLSALSTMRIADIRDGSPIRNHYATCENCSRVVADLQYAEHKLALALSDLRPSYSPEIVAEEAITRSEKLRRRAVARWVRGILGAVALFILGTYIVEKRDVQGMQLETQSIVLRCMNSVDAIDLIRPYVRSYGSAVFRTGGGRVVHITASASEIARAVSVVDSYEDQFCNIPAPGTTVPTPSADKR